MRSALPALLLLGLAAGPVPAQGTAARAVTPDVAALDRLGLKADWSIHVPVTHRQDGIARVQPVDEHQVYVQTRGGLLVALNAATGREEWRYKFPTSFTDGLAVGVNEKFVFSVNVAKLYCHQRYTGVLEFAFDLPEAPSVGPVTDGDQFYVCFSSGKVACYDLPPAFHTSPEAKRLKVEREKKAADDTRKGLIRPGGGLADSVAARNSSRAFTPVARPTTTREQYTAPRTYMQGSVGDNQPTYSLSALQSVIPPFDLGELNKVESMALLPSVNPPYTLTPDFLKYNQLTPSVAVIPPSVARLFELSNLSPPPFEPKLRWITETTGRVYTEPMFVPFAGRAAARLWIAEDGRYLQTSPRDRERDRDAQRVWRLPADVAGGIAGPYWYGDGQVLGFLPLSDGQVLGIDLNAGTPQSPRYQFRANSSGSLNRKPIGMADGVYVGGDRSGSARINVKTGEVDWRTDADVDRIIGVSDTRVFARDRRGNLLVYAKGKADPNTHYARPLGTLPVEGFNVHVPNAATDRAFLASDSGLLVSLREAGAVANKPKFVAPVFRPEQVKGPEKNPGEKKPDDPNAPKPAEEKKDEEKKPEEKK